MAVRKVPAGTEIELTMSWDNSADNPSNPDPTKTVVSGEPPTAEMMFGFVSWADAEPGYIPQNQGGLFSTDGEPREFDPERMKGVLKERFGIDWDTLNEEQRQEIRERFQNRGRNREGAAQQGAASGR